jgi:bile acid:Na+ symporter, BASS family
MTVVRIALFILQLSVVLVVFSLGLEAGLSDVTSLFRRPSLLLRSLFSMSVVMPVFAAFMAAILQLNPAVEIVLIFLAVSPVPAVLPRQQIKRAGSSHVGGLLVSAILLSIIWVPLAIELLGRIFAQDIHIGPVAAAKIMAKTVLLPLAAGMLARRLAPELARKAGLPLSRIALLLLLGAALIPLAAFLPEVAAMLGNGTLLAIIVFVMVGTAVGHLLGGPDLAERSTLALATASRHPGLAVALAGANFSGQQRNVAAVVLLYLIAQAVVLLQYSAWRKRQLHNYGQREIIRPTQRAA